MLVVACMVAVACGQDTTTGHVETALEKQKADSLANCEKPVFDDYKASPLAALMRKMDAEMNIAKRMILAENGNLSDSVSLAYDSIKTATPTDPTVKTDVFAGMADAFLFNVQALQKADPHNRKDIFNTTVSSCISCHQEFCPGPIVRIKKLKL